MAKNSATNYSNRLSFIAFSFENRTPKEKALQKENGCIRGAARSTPRQLFEKSWIKTFFRLGLCEQRAR